MSSVSWSPSDLTDDNIQHGYSSASHWGASFRTIRFAVWPDVPTVSRHVTRSEEINLANDTAGYGSASTGSFHQYPADAPTQQTFLVSPHARSSTESTARGTATSPSMQMRLPPGRDRTPIQHHRTSVSRARSQSRSEHLLAYASEQDQVQRVPLQAAMAVVPSQSAPTTPQIFPMPAYMGQPGSENYGGAGGYFPQSATLPNPPQMTGFNYEAAEMPYAGYYHLERSTSSASIAHAPVLNPRDTVYLPTRSQGAPPTLPSMASTIDPMPPIQTLESTPADMEIISSRPKPQCWDHGCSGRQFSTFSNLLRHQREKSGSVMKAVCPYCGTEFTRTTARNGHMYGGKCKGRPDEGSPGDSSKEQEEMT